MLSVKSSDACVDKVNVFCMMFVNICRFILSFFADDKFQRMYTMIFKFISCLSRQAVNQSSQRITSMVMAFGAIAQVRYRQFCGILGTCRLCKFLDDSE